MEDFEGASKGIATMSEAIMQHVKRRLLAILVLLSVLASITVQAAWAEEVVDTGIPENIQIIPEGDTEVVRVGYYTGNPSFQDGFSDDVRKTGYAYEYLQEIAPIAGWNYEYAYSNREDAIQALLDGDVDIVAGVFESELPEGAALLSSTNMGLTNMGFEGANRYFAVSKDRPDLLAQLNEAQQKVKDEMPAFLVSLWQDHYGEVDVHRALDAEEKAWLEDKKVLKMGIIKSNLPISSIGEDGKPEGAARVVAAHLEEYLGIAVESIGFDTIAEIQDAIYDGRVDCGFPLYADPWLNEARKLFQTQPIINDRAMIIFEGEYREGLMDKVAISRTGLGQRYYVLENYPDSRIFSYENRFACLQAVKSGEVNCIIGCSSILQRMMLENPEFSDYNIAYLDGSEEFALMSPRNNSMLASVLNKAILQLDESDVTNAIIEYSTVVRPYTFMNAISDYAIWIILFLLVVFGILAAVFVAYRKKVRAFNEEQARSRVALEDALAAASNASKAKSAFLSSMSHDIRTPMNGIIGMTAIADANIGDTTRVKDCLAKITSSSKHLLSLINEILDVSKIESGKLELNEEPFSFPEMLEDLIIMNEPTANAKNQKFDVQVEDLAHETVEGDRLRLQQIYTNLVSNAIKYTPEGGSVTVMLAEKPSGSPTIGRFDFIVEDTGIGITEEYLPHIFEAFTRDSQLDKAQTQGTGLGMPIALNLARMMNGDISVKSKVGEGSTFTASVFLKISNSGGEVYEHLRGLNVLVVDDDVDACASICTLLNELGIVSEWTTTGREAVQMVAAREKGYDFRTGEPVDVPYFAVLLDWVMPAMDGKDTIVAMRDAVSREVPIVVVSAHDWTDIEVEARQAGAEAFLSKPLFKSNVALVFEKILGREESEEKHDLNAITANAKFDGMRALLAEDNDLNAEIAIEFLGMTGLELERAANGQIAVEMMQSSSPGYYQCVFMDIQMPVMNGLDAAKAIRALDREDAAEIPIFAMTADAFVDDIKASREVGMNEHFAKPLDFLHVIATLKTYLM